MDNDYFGPKSEPRTSLHVKPRVLIVPICPECGLAAQWTETPKDLKTESPVKCFNCDWVGSAPRSLPWPTPREFADGYEAGYEAGREGLNNLDDVDRDRE